jgi:hypothetical protein
MRGKVRVGDYIIYYLLFSRSFSLFFLTPLICQWFSEKTVPFTDMWPDDSYWLPRLLGDDKSILGRFDYSDDETIVDHSINET